MAIQNSSGAFSLIARRKLLALYAALLRCRMMKDFAASAVGRSKSGHEAPAVAVVLDLKPGDTIAASERDFLPGFVNGASPQTIVSALRARPARARTSSSAMLKVALAAARNHAQRKSRNVAVFFGADGSGCSAAWRNALQIAGDERLPMVFVSQASAGEAGPAQPRSKKAARKSHGYPVITVDGDDVVALYRVASEALVHARRGNGPTLIECVPWPLALPQNGTHAASDAILNMEHYLAQRGIAFERWKRKAIEEFGRQLRIDARAKPALALGIANHLARGWVRS